MRSSNLVVYLTSLLDSHLVVKYKDLNKFKETEHTEKNAPTTIGEKLISNYRQEILNINFMITGKPLLQYKVNIKKQYNRLICYHLGNKTKIFLAKRYYNYVQKFEVIVSFTKFKYFFA